MYSRNAVVRLWQAIWLGIFLTSCGTVLAAGNQVAKVVYHLGDDDPAQIKRALRYINNQLAVEPNSRIVVLAHAGGVDFLLKDATDKYEVEYEPALQELVKRGVEFRACNLTLLSRRLDKTALLDFAKVVPSGVAELTRLQNQEGFAYIRP